MEAAPHIQPPDKELLSRYAADRSEAAFSALVRRHIDLVYATALRQVGDPGIAEEVAQNVFVILARKAPRLLGVETMGGWLHRTAILESKTRVRSELRRRRREERAVELAGLRSAGDSPWTALVPLLDEGLLQLRESDRQALVTRFLEGRSFREVGGLLGVDEEAARKRVTRALDRLCGFFRDRGFAVPTGAGAAVLFSKALTAAPATLTVSATNAGLAAGATAGGLNLIFFYIMSLTKTQIAAVCLLVAGAPFLWQWQVDARLTEERNQLSTQIAASENEIAALEDNLRRIRAAIARAQAPTVAPARSPAAGASQESNERPTYQWNESAVLVRVPKRVVEQMDVSSFAGRNGKLTEQIKEVLQMMEAEALLVEFAVARALADFQAAQSRTLRTVEPAPNELGDRERDEVRVFEVGAIGDAYGPLRDRLFRELEGILGADRFEIFHKAMRNWMPDEAGGLNTGMAVLDFEHRVAFYRPGPGQAAIGSRLETPDRGMFSGPVPLDEIPAMFHGYLADWIALARSRPEGGNGER